MLGDWGNASTCMTCMLWGPEQRGVLSLHVLCWGCGTDREYSIDMYYAGGLGQMGSTLLTCIMLGMLDRWRVLH